MPAAMTRTPSVWRSQLESLKRQQTIQIAEGEGKFHTSSGTASNFVAVYLRTACGRVSGLEIAG